MNSCTLSRCSNLRIWSGLEDLGAAITAQETSEQEHSGYVEDALRSQASPTQNDKRQQSNVHVPLTTQAATLRTL